MKLLSDFETLTAAHEHPELNRRMIANKTQALYLDGTGLYLIVHDIAKGKYDVEILDESNAGTGVFTPHPAKSTCLLIVNTLADSSSDGDDFNFIQGTTKGDGVIAKTEELRDVTLTEYAAQVQVLLDICIAHCNYTVYPFINAKMSQFNSAKGLYKSIAVPYQAGKDIVITLITSLSEKVAVTVWRTEIGFNAENAGRNVHIQTVNKYRIDMSGKKPGDYEVRIPLLDADFSVELI
jgi:hypothetical protein